MKARFYLVIAITAVSFFILLAGCHKPTDPEDNLEITLSASSGKPGELMTLTTNIEVESYQDYQVHFGAAVSPLLQTSDPIVFDIMVPPASAGNLNVYMMHKTDDTQSNKVTFNMQPLPQTGLPAGAYTTDLIDSQTEMVDLIAEDFVSELDDLGAFGTNNPALITNELTRARNYLQTFRNSLSQLPEADRMLLDQLLYSSDLGKMYKQTNKSLKKISQSKTEYTGQYMLVAMDGVSALISQSTRIYALVGFIATVFTGGAAAAPAVGIVFALKTIDNVIDGFIPTDLDYLYVENSVNGNISVPVNGSTEVEFTGRFVPQSNPITESFDIFFDVLCIEVGAESDVILLIEDYFLSAGFSLANNVSNLQNDWEDVIGLDTRINPEFYEAGLDSWSVVISDWTGININAGFISDWLTSISGTPYQVANTGIAHFNSDDSTIEGIQQGTTPITYGGYRFKPIEGWLAGIGMFLGIEMYHTLTSNQMQVCNIVVTDEVLQVATPTFNPPGGSYSAAQSVSITCATSESLIRYTTNGNDPTSSSSVYTSPISISSTTTLKARAYKEYWIDSNIASEQYTIQLSDTWYQKAQFTRDQVGASTFTISNKGYVVGGGQNTGTTIWGTRYCSEYDPLTNTWMSKASHSGNGLWYSASFAVNGLGYIVGGQYRTEINGNVRTNTSKEMWRFNPGNNSWTHLNDFPGASRMGAFGLNVGNIGYMGLGRYCHGSYWGDYYNDFWSYNPQSNQWTQLADFPGEARRLASAFVINNIIYVFGGVNGSGKFNDLWAYNTTTNSWLQKSSAPTEGISEAVGFSNGNYGYLATGSMSSYGYLNTLWRYNSNSDNWTQCSSLPSNVRYGAFGFSAVNLLYVGGGAGSGFWNRDFWMYVP